MTLQDPEAWESALKVWLRSEYDAREGGVGPDAMRARLQSLAPLLDAVGRVGGFAALPAGARLLDAGTGSGGFLIGTVLRFPHFAGEGVDLSPASVEGASATAGALGAPRLAFRVGDLEALPYAAGEFDAALCACTLNLLPVRRQALAEVARVLRPGARFVLVDSFVPGTRAPGGAADPEHVLGEAAACGLRAEAREDLTGIVRDLCGRGAWPWSAAIREDARFLALGFTRSPP